jgi:hypothetical protein
MNVTASFAALSLTALSIACGGNEPQAQSAATASAVAPNAPLADAIGLSAATPVAQWKSGDGLVGLVFDRSGAVPKVKVDGDKDIIQLTAEEVRRSGNLEGTAYKNPKNERMLFISTSGGMEFYRGRDTFRLGPIAKAEALGNPTIAGIAKVELQPNEVLGAKLAAISVRTKMPAFTANDASIPEKVADALSKVDASMIVSYVAKTETATFDELPSGVSGVGYGGVAYKSDVKFDAKTGKGLAKFGGIVKGFSEYKSQGNHMVVQTLDGYPVALANGTPGVVWEVNEHATEVIFVTLDGGRYRVDTSSSTVTDKGAPLAFGIPAAAAWPAPVQHAWASASEITGLAKVGGAAKSVADEVVAADDAWNTCAQGEWKKAKPEIEKLGMTDMNFMARDARFMKLNETWQERVRKTCKPHTDRLDKAVTSFVEERVKLRTAMFEKAKAKFAK